MAQILQHIRVLDLTRIIAGPWCTQNLADMGATVYKIEKPGEGDDTRRMGACIRDAQGNATDESGTFLANNRGKQSITVDIAHPKGAELVRQLAMQCDVVVENYKVGNLAKYGLDAASLRALKPSLIYCSVTGFGQDGPDAKRSAYDFIMQGMSGLMSTCGDPQGSPMRTGVPITDIFTGMYATVAIMGALLHRERTGEGQRLDMAMLDAAVAVNGHMALTHLMGNPPPVRAGNQNPIAAPANVYACLDGHAIISAGNNAQFLAIAVMLGHPEWAQDERFTTNAQRIAHRDALNALIAQAVQTWRQHDLLAAMVAHQIPGGPINTMDQVFAEAQVQHRGLQMTLPHSRGVSVPSLRSPLRFSETPVQEQAAPPMLGEHTAQVLSELLQLDAAAIQQLKTDHVI